MILKKVLLFSLSLLLIQKSNSMDYNYFNKQLNNIGNNNSGNSVDFSYLYKDFQKNINKKDINKNILNKKNNKIQSKFSINNESNFNIIDKKKTWL